MEKNNLLKLAASYLEDLQQRNDELEQLHQKEVLIEKIAGQLVDQQLITTLDEYVIKVAELNEKNVGELENMDLFISSYVPKMKQEFGKLADASISKAINSLSAEEQFIFNLINGGK